MRSLNQIHPTIFTLVVFLIGFIALDGCSSLRNEVDPGQLGLASPKLVVSSFLCPQDTLLAVKITRSNTVIGDSISLLQPGSTVTNATVTLSEGDRSVVLPYYKVRPSADSAYSISAQLLPIIAGKTYKLTVVTANGEKATSSCTIPQPVDPSLIKFDSITEQTRNQPKRYYVKVLWRDPAGRTNAYQVAGIFRYTTPVNVREEKYNSLSFDDDNRGLFSDVGIDGDTIVSGRAFLTPTSSTSNQQFSFYSNYNTAIITVNLLSVDQSYYRYQEAVIRQRRSRGNPFAEPVLIPSNIEGGLGCFAGYNNSTLTRRLK
jgi:hypothetical protein